MTLHLPLPLDIHERLTNDHQRLLTAEGRFEAG